MAQVKANGIDIEVERFGPEERDCVLLIMGVGAQMTLWPAELCEELVARGYHVVRFDNRDVGLSHKFGDKGVPDMTALITALMSGETPEAPYTLDDMAADAVGVLDALGIGKAHIVGASMGGMIAQLVAALYPERTLSLTSIMSTTGNPELPQAKPEAMAALTAPAADPSDLEAVVQRGMHTWKTIGSPAFPTSDEQLREWILRDFHRSFYPDGMVRQMAAILSNGDRRARLAGVTAPTVVLHGEDDPLVPLEGGKDTAASIKGAELVTVKGMGHDFPLSLVSTFADAIEKAARRAGQAQTAE